MSTEMLEESTTTFEPFVEVTTTTKASSDLHPPWLGEMEATIRGWVIPW